MNLPRVLIFGQPFNYRHGGGITLSNLFKGWDKNRLAVAASGHVMYNVTTDVCETYYQLGGDEFIWGFPFKYFQRSFSSGPLKIGKTLEDSPKKSEPRLRYYFVNSIFYPLLEWLGIYHNATQYSISNGFLAWLKEYDPQVLYLQVSSYDTILFARKMQDLLGIPSVLHMMDDWPSTISQKGPFRKKWHRRIDGELRSLMDNAGLLLSISESMSEEYFKRYDKVFMPFHNPIDTDLWTSPKKLNYSLKSDDVKILYSGRIGPGITKSLIEIAQTIDVIAIPGKTLKFHIQSPSAKPETLKKLLGYRCVVLNQVVDYAVLPRIYSEADILVIANDFDQKGLSFLRYSMPTKASEYMISGTPILVYSPAETAVSKFFSQNDCGYCVTDPNRTSLRNAIIDMVLKDDLRKRLGNNAKTIAVDLFNADKVRDKFRNLICSLI
jgi:glycosyltransferase involved in cell wall biosynthesis